MLNSFYYTSRPLWIFLFKYITSFYDQSTNVVLPFLEKQMSILYTAFVLCFGITVDNSVDTVDNPELRLFVDVLGRNAKNKKTLRLV